MNVPLFAPVEGALFVDYGTDLDSGSSVLGNPAGERDTVSLPLAVSLTVSTVYSRRETR
jgi:hypothetical protein